MGCTSTLWPESLHLSKGLFNVLKFRAESNQLKTGGGCSTHWLLHHFRDQVANADHGMDLGWKGP